MEEMSSLVLESQLEIQKLENADYLLLPEGRGAEHIQEPVSLGSNFS